MEDCIEYENYAKNLNYFQQINEIEKNEHTTQNEEFNIEFINKFEEIKIAIQVRIKLYIDNMIIEKQPDGLLFTLEQDEWACDVFGFFEEIKTGKFGVDYEYDEENKQWWIPECRIQEFYSLKRAYFDAVLHRNQLDIFEE